MNRFFQYIKELVISKEVILPIVYALMYYGILWVFVDLDWWKLLIFSVCLYFVIEEFKEFILKLAGR